MSIPNAQPLEEYPYSSTVSGLLSGTTIRDIQIRIPNHSTSPVKENNLQKENGLNPSLLGL
jgi:hypothetical protein